MTNKTAEEKPRYVCPKGHIIIYERWSYARDFSGNLRDADGRPVFEGGLWCYECNRAYGLSKLTEKSPTNL